MYADLAQKLPVFNEFYKTSEKDNPPEHKLKVTLAQIKNLME